LILALSGQALYSSADIHLGIAFISGWIYAAGAIFAKQALNRGCGLWHTNFFSNVAIGVLGAPLWFFVEPVVAKGAWSLAIYAGVAFLIAQVFIFLAYARSDPSITTPLVGTKVLWVALVSAVVFAKSLSSRWWWAAGLAVLGIFLVTWQPNEGRKFRGSILGASLSIVAAVFFGSSDVLLAHAAQHVGGIGALAMLSSEVGLFTLAIYPVIFGKKIWIIPADKGRSWLALGLGLLTLEAVVLRSTIAISEEAVAANILYSARCMWGVLLTWWMSRFLNLSESKMKPSAMLLRLLGAVMLSIAILIVLL
jgi:drug/metabolite transporter (DMT)-like permease